MPNSKVYDLAERTAKFSEAVIKLVVRLPKTQVNEVLVNQVIRSATSVGANYMEADGAGSKKDFQHKIGLCRKESKETQYWLRIIASANNQFATECRVLSQEAYELSLIFYKINHPS